MPSLAEQRRQDVIDTLRPMQPGNVSAAALDVRNMNIFRDQGDIVISLRTVLGSVNLGLPPSMAYEIGDSLLRLVEDVD